MLTPEQILRTQAMELTIKAFDKAVNGNMVTVEPLIDEAAKILKFLKGEDADHLQAK